MKKITLISVILLLSSSLYARSIERQGRTIKKVIKLYDKEFRGRQGATIFLKKELKRQGVRFDLKKAKLVEVKLVAKSRMNRGKVVLQAGNFRETYDVHGTPYDFYNRQAHTFDRIFMEPYTNGKGPWQLHFRGNIIVRKVVLFINVRGKRPGPIYPFPPGPNPRPPRPPRPLPGPGGTMIPLQRFFSPVNGDHRITTFRNAGHDYRLEGTLGYISTDYKRGTQPLFECLVRGRDHMLSLQQNCEGHRTLTMLGHIDQRNSNGKRKLFRCIVPTTGNHFASFDPRCEGQRTEATLGFL